MRPPHLKLIATALLGVGAILIIRHSVWQDPGSSNPAISPSAALPSRSRDLPQAPAARPQAATLTERPAPHAAVAAVQPPTSSQASAAEATSDKQPMGIRLADNVRLPAVILALSDPNRDPHHKTPAPVAAAMQAIVDTFYQDLAASVQDQLEAAKAAAGQPPAGSANATSIAPGTDNTVVIQPGPAVDRAWTRANETYRALFGDEAYNRLTMSAAIEVKLPLDSSH